MTQRIAAEHAPDEHLTGFHLPELGVRGGILRASAGVRSMLARCAAGDDLQRLVGELMAAGPLMAAQLKLDGRLTLQVQKAAQVELLVVQADRQLRVRGMARGRDGSAAGDFQTLCADGIFAATFEPRGGQSYQALVPISGTTVAEALRNYFLQSEQLPSHFVLAATADSIAGCMLQRLPDAADDGGWEHAATLAGTLAAEELLAHPPSTILHRLFHAEALALHEPRPLTVACSCSHDRTSRLLLGLGESEIVKLLAEQGRVEVSCDFCGAQYVYDEAEVRALFAGEADMSAVPAPDQTRH